MRPRPKPILPEAAPAARPLPSGFRAPGTRSSTAPKPEAPPDSLELSARLTLMRGDSTERGHVLWLKVEVERGSNAAARLCEIAEQGRMRGVQAVLDVTQNGVRFGGGK